MHRPSFRPAALILLSAAAFAVACRKPPAPAPAPQPGPNADSIARANAQRDSAARAEAARRDAAARAEAARRDSIARAEAARKAAADAAAAAATLAAPIHFDYDEDELKADALAALQAKALVLRDHAGVRIRINGHADDRGSDEYNLALGQRRAGAAKRFLASRGIADSRVDTESFGEQRPLCEGETEDCRYRNRRDEFVIVAGAISPRP